MSVPRLERISLRTLCTVCDTEFDWWAWDIGVAGLLVQPAHQHCAPTDEWWHIVHHRSAAAVILCFESPEAAFAAAWEIAALMDWTLAGEELRRLMTPDIGHRLAEVRDRYDATSGSGHGPARDLNVPA